MTHIRYQSVQTREGDNAEVRRLFPLPGRLMNYDPFVLWDDFTVRPGTGFPTHPHRGFEAVTYLFSGEMQHRDNLGNHSTVGPGGAQRFTAGKGIEHSTARNSQDPTGARENHGDRCVADVVANYALYWLKNETVVAPKKVVPEHSFAGRRIAWERKQRELEEVWA